MEQEAEDIPNSDQIHGYYCVSSIITCEEMVVIDHWFKGIVNKYHSIYPNTYLEDTINTWPTGTILVLKFVDNRVRLFSRRNN